MTEWSGRQPAGTRDLMTMLPMLEETAVQDLRGRVRAASRPVETV